ncbi:ubiquinone biosynthesis hydroxylase [Cohaesibacter celericrescens]|uniref:2-octaprenyl-6-methoxyphenyl hydroxylase n=1 Tax=Cohaesibacter celericrescens TaxID=2067669 RepID=A0A2N5XP49_9HYPH|nr:ubiquinone biosynthesis hydroxylase [Cohaesibacter celericrescens]PLW76306.1 2-octaprenyl-6-methoxyphenyl hydroxylase [Cohaesibacter celericrescens]
MTKGGKMDQTDIQSRYDLVIAGGGYVGLSLALAIKQASDLSILVVEPQPAEKMRRDERASAIASGATKMLGQLGVWEAILPHAEPIQDMVVTDSKLHDIVRPVLLTFEGNTDEGVPFAHMVPNGVMVGALYDAAKAAGVDLVEQDTVLDFVEEGPSVEVTLGSGRNLRAGLLVAADGVRSRLRDLAGIPVVRFDYDQMGIVTTVEHERPHEGRAVEHFLPSGPFAILPLKGNHSSLVWNERTDDAKRLLKMDDFTFSLELERRFGKQLGAVTEKGPRKGFPLGMVLARSFVSPRFALIGDAAHGIHPIAGQGLNLGFKDVAALAEVIVEAARLGQDIGALDVLERYQTWRRFDVVQMGMTCDILNRLFSNKSDILRHVRDLGLGIVERLPGLKRMFIEEAAGNSGDIPRLLRGEGL